MTTLNSLKQALRQEPTASTQPLSDTQYDAGFDILVQGLGWKTYEDFIVPQLSQLLAHLVNLRTNISVLEIGPGPRSVLGYLHSHVRRKIKSYTALEPNGLFATRLAEQLCSGPGTEPLLPCLENPPGIHRIPFDLHLNTGNGTDSSARHTNGKYDIILFCHSMYGMKPERDFVERALSMLVEEPQGGMVVIFHRDGALHLNGLVCSRTASFPNGVISVQDEDEMLDRFALFVAGFTVDEPVRFNWRKICRDLGFRKESHRNQLLFSSPNVMATFTKHADALPELIAQVPVAKGDTTVKNREARLHCPAAIVEPTGVSQVQQCVQWALKHRLSLAVIGGGHGGHCLQSNIVSVDMSAFNQIHVLKAEEEGIRNSVPGFGSLIVVEAGCKAEDVVRKTMAEGLTVPLGARPSVGAGLWLQGGIGHLTRLHGLTCDAIIGIVMVSVESGRVLCIGRVPSQHWPASAIRPENEADLLWAIKGAGTNFGIVLSVVFKSCAEPNYLIRKCVMPLSDDREARLRLSEFGENLAKKIPRNSSADAYLYWEANQLHLGVTTFEVTATGSTIKAPMHTTLHTQWGLAGASRTVVDGIRLFESEMYVSGMHGGHTGGKTSSFKRCVFLKRIGEANIADRLVAALKTRPSPLCYFHLLQGGGAVRDIEDSATAFGCRDWEYACVITGVWPRNEDSKKTARSTIQWVYNVAEDLLPLSSGVYGADLGPDPRDAKLAAKAFGPNLSRLTSLKHKADPHNVLAYACPLPEAPPKQKLIILVTGESCAGKDYCADIWVSVFTRAHGSLTTCAVSISDRTKREYAAATGADLSRLLSDRTYKEHHRPALTEFHQEEVRQRPQLQEKHFLDVVHNATDVDVLLITGMRDEAPVAAFSHLVPGSRLVEIYVQVSEETRQGRKGCSSVEGDRGNNKGKNYCELNSTTLKYRPGFIFDNDTSGDASANFFAEQYLLPFVHEDLQRLADMVPRVPSFPSPGIDFRHVLNISQQPGGLALCTSLLQSHFVGDWTKVSAIACCEAGGYIFASALALQVGVPLVLIREAGKLPPPTVSATKTPSYISSSAPEGSKEKRIEMERDVVPSDGSVVVVDDVLSTGETLCAVLQLLDEAGVSAENVSVMVVAEFPVHRGRERLRGRGFGRVNVQSLLVFGGD